VVIEITDVMDFTPFIPRHLKAHPENAGGWRMRKDFRAS
jgi:hypothetical protein